MATTTKARLTVLLATATGFYFSGTNTGTANNTVVDTGLQRWDTNRLIDRWVYITSGDRVDESRRILSVSTSTATLVTALSGVLSSGNTFNVLPFDPDIMHFAIEEALRTVWPKRIGGRYPRGLFQRLTDETLVVDNLIDNFSFEDFNSPDFDDWVQIGTPTLTQATTGSNPVVHGTYAARIAASGATEGIEQDLEWKIKDIIDSVGKVLHVRAWVWAGAADAVRIRVSFNGTTFTSSPFHRGSADYEGHDIQGIDATIPADYSEAMVSCEVTDGNLGYFDHVVAWVDAITEYTVPTKFYPGGVHRVFQQVDEDRPEGLYLPIRVGNAVPGRVLRLEGVGRLSVPTTDSGTTEIDEIEAELVVAEAAMHMFRVLADTEPQKSAEYLQRSATWERTAADLRSSVGSALMGGNKQIGWRISPENSRVLYLDR